LTARTLPKNLLEIETVTVVSEKGLLAVGPRAWCEQNREALQNLINDWTIREEFAVNFDSDELEESE
jgi:hypothetical protein